ncbi:MAG: DUF3616 domain-containing protein [Pseudanabaena frigida]|uniref:DUF3616 domain-containing protein n=1 Tax=Pseudanabaena frigida TaxID=945775 RepID=A0A2W4WG26_9CYAN|nr:MAG: DUF3616 domain-containing protein [Pseudanabaena frigida]
MTSSISLLGPINIIGNIYDDDKKNESISAIEVVDDFLIVGADEGNKVKVLKRNGDGYAVVRSIQLRSDKEIDIEGIACEGSAVYVIGSHSYKREKIKLNQSYEQNRKAIATVLSETQRDQLFRFSLNADAEIEKTSLRSIIELNDSNNLLYLFSRIPSKENGVDIEGLAVHNGLLYVGFRGPVLRDNWVPILKCKFAQPIVQADLVFVNLGGRGVRDITRVNDGFLILAGAVGDGLVSYQVYFWDGEDCLIGNRKLGNVGRLDILGELPVYENAKAEGLALLKESDSAYEVLIVFDGVKNGDPKRFRIIKK